MFGCQLCQQENDGEDETQQKMEFANLDELEAHLASEHFNCLAYECEQCQFAKFPTEFAVMKHNEQDHGNKNYSFRCRITPGIKKKREQIRQFLLSMCATESQTEQQPANNSASGTPQIGGQVGSKKKFAAASPDFRPRSIKSELPEEMSTMEQQQKGKNEMEGAEEMPTTLTEQLQAACAQNIRRSKETNGGGREMAAAATKSSSSAYGGTMEIREGLELASNLLTATKNGVGHDGPSMVEDGAADDQFRQQEADVQEILKAAAMATSQVGIDNNIGDGAEGGGGGGPLRRHKTNQYSLRPNRFSPYAFLQQQNHQNWTNQFAEGGFGRKSAGGGGGVKIQFKHEKVIDRIQCRKCGEMVNSTGGCLMHHLNTRHLRLPLFQCTLCNKDFYEVSNTRIHKHMRIHHHGDTTNLVSNYAKYAHTLHAGRDECFGTREERLRAIHGERASIKNEFAAAANNSGSGGGIKMGGTVGSAATNSKLAEQNCATVRAIFHQHQQQGGGQKNDEDGSAHSPPPLRLAGPRKFSKNISQDDDYSGTPSAGGNYDDEFEVGDTFLGDGGEEEEEEEGEQQQFEEGEDGEGPYAEDGEEEDEGDRPPPGAVMINGGGASSSSSSAVAQHFGGHNGAKVGWASGNGQQHGGSFPVMMGSGGGAANRPAAPYQMMIGRMQMQLGLEEKIPCRVCGEMVLNKLLNRLNHVNVRHLQLPLHQCRICQKSFTSYSRSACYSHVQFAHRTDLESGQCSQNIEEHIIYKKEQYNNQLLEAANDYFD